MMAEILTFFPVLIFSVLYVVLVVYIITLLRRLVIAVEKIAEK
jgi:hypothetical protein